MADAAASIPNFRKSLIAVLVILTLINLSLFINSENDEILFSNDKILEKRIDSLKANMMHNMDNLFGNDVILIGNDKIMAKKINEKAQETSGPMRTADTDSNEDVLG